MTDVVVNGFSERSNLSEAIFHLISNKTKASSLKHKCSSYCCTDYIITVFIQFDYVLMENNHLRADDNSLKPPLLDSRHKRDLPLSLSLSPSLSFSLSLSGMDGCINLQLPKTLSDLCATSLSIFPSFPLSRMVGDAIYLQLSNTISQRCVSSGYFLRSILHLRVAEILKSV